MAVAATPVMSDISTFLVGSEDLEMVDGMRLQGRRCCECGKGPADKHCSRCKVTTYCSLECQKASWYVQWLWCQHHGYINYILYNSSSTCAETYCTNGRGKWLEAVRSCRQLPLCYSVHLSGKQFTKRNANQTRRNRSC